jgi:hypothetical protein
MESKAPDALLPTLPQLDNGDGNASGDQAILDGRSAGLIAQEPPDDRSH